METDDADRGMPRMKRMIYCAIEEGNEDSSEEGFWDSMYYHGWTNSLFAHNIVHIKEWLPPVMKPSPGPWICSTEVAKVFQEMSCGVTTQTAFWCPVEKERADSKRQFIFDEWEDYDISGYTAEVVGGEPEYIPLLGYEQVNFPCFILDVFPGIKEHVREENRRRGESIDYVSQEYVDFCMQFLSEEAYQEFPVFELNDLFIRRDVWPYLQSYFDPKYFNIREYEIKRKK